MYEVLDGDWVFFRFTNNTPTAINFAVLDLESTWKIEQTYPRPDGSSYETLGPHTWFDLPIRMGIPNSETTISDIFKVIFTAEPTSFKWLELPALDDQKRSPAGQGPTQTGGVRGGSAYAEDECLYQAWNWEDYSVLDLKIRTRRASVLLPTYGPTGT